MNYTFTILLKQKGLECDRASEAKSLGTTRSSSVGILEKMHKTYFGILNSNL